VRTQLRQDCQHVGVEAWVTWVEINEPHCQMVA
jgi:hypothetical protein